MDSAQLAERIAAIASDRKASDIRVVDLRGIVSYTDFFVICSGTSDRQMRTLTTDLVDYSKSIGQKVYHIAGMESAHWILMDFVDVVVHVFDEALRKYYDLELIWGEAPRVQWRSTS